jgi:hypothetical protein
MRRSFWMLSEDGRKKKTALRCAMDALELEASSTVSTRNTSFRSRSDWLYTTLTISTWNEPADQVK